MLAQGDRAGAIALLQQAIGQEPNNHALHAELADLLVMDNRVDEARQILAGLPEDTEGIDKARNRIWFLDEAESLPPVETFGEEAEVGTDPGKRIDLAIRLVSEDRIEEALEHLLTAMKQDERCDEERARKTMIRVFDLLGKGNELATQYRRKMFTFLALNVIAELHPVILNFHLVILNVVKDLPWGYFASR
ncbi:MAG: tetratricopeptide repeat protein [Gammaproteobacteria bacterium]|nr:tetratricopeptide repeat protein [Gammaproteobacteria bacterium]